jgi:hypothetical protein
LRQADARLERAEDELVQREAKRASLRAVPDLDPELDLDRWSGVDLDDDDLLASPSTGRSRPRRPTGAAADYARASTGEPRRTVRIGGYGAQSALRPTPSELRGPRPDRIAAWGFGFAIFVALLAALVGG